MPRGSKGRLMRFSRALATGMGPYEAAIAVGYPDGPSAKSNARSRACRLDVKRMVAEIRNLAAERLEITLDELIKRVDELFKLASSSGQLGAALNALKELGILSGKRIERAERGEPGEFDRMSDGELRQTIADRAQVRHADVTTYTKVLVIPAHGIVFCRLYAGFLVYGPRRSWGE